MKKKIVFFTGNRAEYYLLIPVILSFLNSNKFTIFLIRAFDIKRFTSDNSIKTLEKKIYSIIDLKIEYSRNSHIKNTHYFGNIIKNASNILHKIKPNLLFVYGDRFETFATVNSAFQMSIPIAHIEGGDITTGGLKDDFVRHAITKLSHLHFVTNKKSFQKIINLGEEKWRIKNIGFTGNYFKKFKASKKEITDYFDLNNSKKIIIFTLHPDDKNRKRQDKKILVCIKVLKYFSQNNYKIIITSPNNEYGSDVILRRILSFVNKDRKNSKFYHNLGSYYYNGLLSLAEYKDYKIVCLGNSSSGIKETPIFKCPSINIGSRQKGRLKADNVINSKFDEINIINSINKATSSKFLNNCMNIRNPYKSKNLKNVLVNFISSIDFKSQKFLNKNEK